MHKIAMEQQAVLEAMQKIASANGYHLTPQVAKAIAYQHQYSPVLIMKTAAMTQHEALKWQTYRANLPITSLLGVLPGAGPLIADSMTPGWSHVFHNTIKPNLIGAGLGGALGASIPFMLGTPMLPSAALGTALGGMLGSYLGARHYVPVDAPMAPEDALSALGWGGLPIGMIAGAASKDELPTKAIYS